MDWFSNWLSIALLAQVILGTSAVFDKLLLRKRAVEPVGYTFWLGMVGGLAIVLIPFGVELPPDAATFLIGLLSGALFIAGMYFLYLAVERGAISEAFPLVGGLSPIATALAASILLAGGLGLLGWFGFLFLTAASFAFFLTERRRERASLLPWVLASAIAFGVSNVAAKAVFDATNFVSGFLWIKLGGVAAAMGFLASPSLRAAVRRSTGRAASGNRLTYFLNRGYAGAGSLLAVLAISLAHPALVDATQGLKYFIVFAAAWFLIGERPASRGRLVGKIAATGLVIIGLAVLALGEYARNIPPVDPNRPIAWGVTFSQKFSRDLGLDWRENFSAILGELKPKRLRLIAYWDEIEPVPGEFRFADLDWQIAEAERAGIPVLVAMGLKLPRWPECHVPAWAAALADEERESALLVFLERVVARYESRSGVFAWQVENEPFLPFGDCSTRSEEAVRAEIGAVRGLDASRPIVLTDGGEFGLWYRTERLADIFGTTMYRKAYPRIIGPLFGRTIEYPFPPEFFRIKEMLVRAGSANPAKRFIVIELQGEPWEPRSLAAYSPEELTRSFSPSYFRETIQYAKATGFEEYYLWGAEWWYYMREKHNDSRYWEITRALFRETMEQ